MAQGFEDVNAGAVAAKALKLLDEERRTHWDRRAEFQDWSEGVYKGIEATQEDVREVKKDIKKILADNATMNTAVELLKSDHKHAEEHRAEMKKLINGIKNNGCDVYSKHRQADTAAVEPLARIGHTWPDLISRFDKTNLGFIAIIAMLMYLMMGGWGNLLTFLGFS